MENYEIAKPIVYVECVYWWIKYVIAVIKDKDVGTFPNLSWKFCPPSKDRSWWLLKIATGQTGQVSRYKGGQYNKEGKTLHPTRNVPNVTENVVYLTFDDGPYTEGDKKSATTMELLEAIKQYNESVEPEWQAHATFMVNGVRVNQDEEHREITKSIVVDYNHNLGNHGYSHKYLDEISGDEGRSEVIRNRLLLIKVMGGSEKVVNALRPPGERYKVDPNEDNNHNHILVNSIGETGHTLILSRIYGHDDRDPDASIIRENIRRTFERARTKFKERGAIILLHNGRSNTIKALVEGDPALNQKSILEFFRTYQVGDVPKPFKVRPLPNLPAIWTDEYEEF